MSRLWKRTASSLVAVAVVTIGLGAAGLPASAAPSVRCGGPHYYQDGEVYPVLCPSGRPNTRVFSVLRNMTPRIMSLTSSARYAQIRSAVCGDLNDAGTVPIVTASYSYQYARFHWAGANIAPERLGLRATTSAFCA